MTAKAGTTHIHTIITGLRLTDVWGNPPVLNLIATTQEGTPAQAITQLTPLNNPQLTKAFRRLWHEYLAGHRSQPTFKLTLELGTPT